MGGSKLAKLISKCRKTNKCEWEVPLTINPGQQRKHIKGTNEHKTATLKGTKSELFESIDPQVLLTQYAGSGSKRAGELGKSGIKRSLTLALLLDTQYL
jgi:hypothetical protein